MNLPILRDDNEEPRFERQRIDDNRSTIQPDRIIDLEAQLRSKLSGEVRFDAGSRALYATDGSNYRQGPPRAVAGGLRRPFRRTPICAGNFADEC